jgi:hypothetical protein
MEKALAEVSRPRGRSTKFDVTTDIGSILTRVDDQIHSAGAIQVASDLSDQGEALKAKAEAEKAHGREVLQQFKIEQGLVEPTTAPSTKTVGPQKQALPQPEEG